MRGLPFTITPHEIVKFFKEFKVKKKDITIEYRRGKSTGYALVFLTNKTTVPKAQKALDQQMIGDRYINVY